MSTPNEAPKTTYRPAPPRLVQVKEINDISPGLRRITFSGENLHDYPPECEGWHLKILLPREGELKPALPTLTPQGPQWRENEVPPFIRTYSVRAIRLAQREIDIEFALHDGVAGPALNFARRARPGDWIGISNPGGPDPMLPEAKHYFMAGDPTSLPAIAALLEKLAPDAQGKVVIRVDNESDTLDLRKPEGVEVVWLTGDISLTDRLVDTFTSWALPAQDVTFWIGGEDRIIKALRRYIRREKGYDRQRIYAIPYWRHGYDEERYHDLRHEIMDSQE
ncbi:siderophore-interacting protein [Brenneria tiliae]|uniref:Siderophore-interacting protein n=1 Tax=Brenneria tiliae TaxID=2914984 RepID=A0ABT0MXS0_9GAMM|nr:siderophore-interacting protein [Brenneria tiliae]MCL2894367.1 siderophore-interacting protein [Brenneria tiliae]MCL2897264.1 siderophore-interacting protein [Brenneria tiliae]MCL2901793.1 siderophore-interacting protein [Brenneria tiliae]